MGLDQYFFASKAGEKPLEIGYLRKHNWIHGWMEELWEKKGKPLPKDWNEEQLKSHKDYPSFNCIPVRLTLKDIKALRKAIKGNKLKQVDGFFFGDWGPDEDTKKEELAILRKLDEYISDGYKVFYDSWW